MRLLRRNGCDPCAGFTVIELMIAMAVFFIVFTAIMSLALTNTLMSVQARQKANMVNAANSYIERVRQLPYTSIGEPGGTGVTPTGTLAPRNLTANGFSIDITPTVTWIDDATIPGAENYKRLHLVVTGRPATGGRALVYESETFVKETDSGVNPNAQLPAINFTSDSPASGEVVMGSDVMVGASVQAQGDGVSIVTIKFYVDGVPLHNSVGGTAEWSLNVTSIEQKFHWDTLAEYEEPGTLRSPDGEHELKVEAWDTNGNGAFVFYKVIVDNSPPSSPTTITAVPVTSTQMRLSWPVALDGSSPAAGYIVSTWVQPITGTDTSGPGTWNGPSSLTYATNGTVVAATPLSRYYYYLRAQGVPPESRQSTSGVWTIAVSRPDVASSTWTTTITGNGTNQKTNSTNVIKVSPATFPFSAVTSTLIRATNSAMTASRTETVMSNPWQHADVMPEQTDNKPVITPYYYQVRTVITPSGFAGGDPVTVLSQVIGPNGTTAGTGSFPVPATGWQ